MGSSPSEPAEGARARKRRETRQHIAETGLRLFLTNGYENTTLDSIAAEAGISRRTFFSYFKSKEDLLFIWQSEAWGAVWRDLLAVSPDEQPLDAVRGVFIRHLAHYANGRDAGHRSAAAPANRCAPASRWPTKSTSTRCSPRLRSLAPAAAGSVLR